jgi:hypothetical protein
LATDVDGRTRIAWGASIERAWSGSAATWVLPERASSGKGREGATARLRGLELHAPDGVRLRAAELRVALPLGGNALPLAARSTGALFASPEPYARWIGAKRLLLPACGWMLAAGLLATGLRVPRAPALVPVAGAFALVWALVRALDGGVRGGGLGVGWACALLLGAVGVATALAWAWWRDA